MPRAVNLLVIFHAAILLLGLVFLIRQKGQRPFDRERIVILPIEGVISHQSNSIRGDTVENLVATINALKDQDDVKAVVLRINSPGGSIGAVQDIYGALQKLKEKKKIIVSSFGDVSASGGYYVASLSDKIYCQPGTLTGSIGVILQMPNIQGLLNKIGVSFEVIKSGEMKDAGSPFRQLRPEERAYFTEIMKDAFDQFYQAVKVGRKLEDAALKPLADGRVFSGRMALKNKLVDNLGGLDDAVEEAKKLAGLESKKPLVVVHRDKRSLERLMEIVSKSPLNQLASGVSTSPQLLYEWR
jgi:protease-4